MFEKMKQDLRKCAIILLASLCSYTSAQANPTTKVQPHTTTKAVAAQWQIATIKNGDNAANIFHHQGLKQQQLQQILALPQAAKYLHNLHVGSKLQLLVNSQHQLEQLNYPVNKTTILSIQLRNGRFQEHLLSQNIAATKPLAPLKQTPAIPSAAKTNTVITTLNIAIASTKPPSGTNAVNPGTNNAEKLASTSTLKQANGTIHSSLHAAIKKAELPASTSQQLCAIFKEQIDLTKNIHPGDQFQLIYQPTSKANKSPAITILAARFITHGKTYEAVRYADPKGHIAYYRPDGKGIQKGFNRIPVQNARISSGFSLSRLDPIFNIVRPHLGVDFAAPMGTPIKATSDGRIIFLGQKNGYGNTVIIKRDEHYSTLYAHVEDFADDLHTGSTVQQGQVIAYVGNGGHSTGPHLHYEFWVDGARRNPLTVDLPAGSAIPKHYLAKFTSQAHYLLAKLDTSQHVQLAANTNKKVSKARV